MYVRWKKRLRTCRHRSTGEFYLSAVLLESHRVNGRPRQKFVTYLGTVLESYRDSYWHMFDFWKSADKKLDTLSLEPTKRSEIEARLLEVVHRPTQADKERTYQALSRLEAQMTNSLRHR